MTETLGEVEFETRTIGPLVLTTPMLSNLGFREIVNRHCPIAEQGDIDHGTIAELVVQCRLSTPRALYDMVDWAETYAITELTLSWKRPHNSTMIGWAACWMLFTQIGPLSGVS